jgi:hypothetical protein
MRRSFKIVAAVAALAMPASLAAVSLSGTAGASVPTTIKCSKMSGNINTTIKITGAKCKAKPPKGYGNVSFTATSLIGGGTINWTGAGDSITVSAPTTTGTTPPQGGCAHGYIEQDSTGTVTAGTDHAGTYDSSLVGGTYSSRTCVNGAGKITLVKHTSFTL